MDIVRDSQTLVGKRDVRLLRGMWRKRESASVKIERERKKLRGVDVT